MGVKGAASIAAAAGAAILCSSCTFGILKADQCMADYGEGMTIAAAAAREHGGVAKEAFSYCLDGRGRADAMARSLRALGFEVLQPKRHFEVPGAWCLGGARVPTGPFDPMRSLQAACDVGQASRAYMTGGSLTASDGSEHHVISAADRKAREELEKPLANTS